MKIELPDARYVMAVSGGVDSVVLLDCLVESNQNLVTDGKIIVAHFDHGIREDSFKDALFVEELASKYGLQYVVGHGGLGPMASEEAARAARYDFLRFVKDENYADAIITAHHQDDVIETAIINLIRGTGRRGLTSLKSKQGILRPLLSFSKAELIQYARNHGLDWREDSTNLSDIYLRNRVRKLLSNKLDTDLKDKFLTIIGQLEHVNKSIDYEIDKLVNINLRRSKHVVPRRWFLKLPYEIACEVALALARANNIKDIDAKKVDLLIIFIKTAKVGKKIDIDKYHYGLITKRSFRLMKR